MSKTALSNLKKAHEAQAITKDSYTLQQWVAKNEGELMNLTGVEAKYIPQYDAASPLAKPGVSGNGYRVRFILDTGETVGTFSGAAYNFFQFLAQIVGVDTANYSHIDIKGTIPVRVSKVALEAGKSTYNFVIDDKAGELEGFSQYVPTAETIMALPEGTADTE